MPDDDDRRIIALHAYTPRGVKEIRAYDERLRQLVDAGHITQQEAQILSVVKMTGIAIDAGIDQSVRRPTCQTCGATAIILGNVAQAFRCSCSPDVEQSIADTVRRQ
jgi:hypothetical protein